MSTALCLLNAVKALQTITGERHGNAKAWSDWWKANKATFQVPGK
jgi:hypothetical protein